MRNIGLIGNMGTGKTTIANYLVERYGYHKSSLAAPMRQFVTDVLRIDKHDQRYRPAMQELGTEWGRKYDQDCWVNYLINNLDMYPTVVDDVRFPNEAGALIKAGWMLIYLECPPGIRRQRCLDRDGNYDDKTEGHASETGVDEIEGRFSKDLVYINAGVSVDEVLRQIDGLMKNVMSEEWPRCPECKYVDSLCEIDRCPGFEAQEERENG